MCNWHIYGMPNRHQKSLCRKDGVLLIQFGKNRFLSFAFDKEKCHSTTQHTSAFPLERGGSFLLQPRPWSKYCRLVFIVLGNRKGLVHLNASSFPECMEQGKNEVLGIPLTAIFLFLCIRLPTFLQQSHTLQRNWKPCSGSAYPWHFFVILSNEAWLYWEHQKIPGGFLGDVQHLIGCILVVLSFICPPVNDSWGKIVIWSDLECLLIT